MAGGPQPNELPFEWDDEKADANFGNHGVSFDEAREAFRDPLGVYDYDADHSTATEHRYSLIGFSSRRLLFVVYTTRGEAILLIHARVASRRMEQDYVETNS